MNWTDDRLDALSDRMDERFDRVEMDQREMRSELNLRFDRMQQTLFVTGGGIIAALLGVIATQI